MGGGWALIAMSRRRPPVPPLKPDERILWEKVTRSTRPLRHGPRVPADGAPDLPPASDVPQAAKPPSHKPPRKPAPVVAAKPPPLNAIERRLTQRLGRGQRQVEARIDLHGMRQSEAQEALYAFLVRAQARGLSLVLVITGKGGAAPREDAEFMTGLDIGILRGALPNWLALPRFRQLVVGFTPAQRRHGGEGAIYVQLRRTRR